jgi:hypothetical protein
MLNEIGKCLNEKKLKVFDLLTNYVKAVFKVIKDIK